MELACESHNITKTTFENTFALRPGMQAVVQCVAYKSKANVTADYENINYCFPAPIPIPTALGCLAGQVSRCYQTECAPEGVSFYQKR